MESPSLNRDEKETEGEDGQGARDSRVGEQRRAREGKREGPFYSASSDRSLAAALITCVNVLCLCECFVHTAHMRHQPPSSGHGRRGSFAHDHEEPSLSHHRPTTY